MNKEYAIELIDINKHFFRTDSTVRRLGLICRNLFSIRNKKSLKPNLDLFFALQSIDVKIEKGEAFGILGRNGAGKSTLLQIIAKTLFPSSGEVIVNGKVNALLELGSGFNPEFTGRENVYLNGTVLGFSKLEIDERFDEIVEFSEIGDFVDQPVKHYSSGMLIRLAFSVQAMLEPDILIVDEALAVGDIFFVQKCHDKIEQLLKNKKTTFVFVTHDLLSIQKYCSRAMVLDHGKCLFIGDSTQAIYEFQNIENGIIDANKHINLEKDSDREKSIISLNDMKVVGRRDVIKLEYLNIFDDSGKSNLVFTSGTKVIFHYKIRILQDILTPIIGFEILNARNVLIYAINNLVDEQFIELPEKILAGSVLSIRQELVLPLEPGQYLYSFGFASIRNEIYIRKFHLSGNEISTANDESIRFINLPPITISTKPKYPHSTFYGIVQLENHFSFDISNSET
jgi:ABC-type polysaccharide/polyol phosphate transport system ATPase subunit